MGMHPGYSASGVDTPTGCPCADVSLNLSHFFCIFRTSCYATPPRPQTVSSSNCVLLKLCLPQTVSSLNPPGSFSLLSQRLSLRPPGPGEEQNSFSLSASQSSSASYEVGPTSVLPSDLMTVLRIPRGLWCLSFSLPLGSLRTEVTGPPVYSGHCFLSFKLHSSTLTRPT